MTTQQTEAQRLAEDLQLNGEYCPENVYLEAAAELRRLEAANAELLKALDSCEGTLSQCFPNAPVDSVIGKNIGQARAALQKHGGHQ